MTSPWSPLGEGKSPLARANPHHSIFTTHIDIPPGLRRGKASHRLRGQTLITPSSQLTLTFPPVYAGGRQVTACEGKPSSLYLHSSHRHPPWSPPGERQVTACEGKPSSLQTHCFRDLPPGLPPRKTCHRLRVQTAYDQIALPP